MKHIKHDLLKILHPHKHKRAFLHGRLFAEWSLIVGDTLAKITQPHKITHYGNQPGTLTLDTTSSSSLHLHMMEEEIIQKINTFFKKELINKLRYKHVLQIKKNIPQNIKDLSDHDKTKLDKLLERFENDEAKNKLEKLGRAIFLKSLHSESSEQ